MTTVGIDLGTNEGSFPVFYDMYMNPDQMEIFYESELLYTTGGLVQYQNNFTVNYSGTSTTIQVVMTAPNVGTEWVFQVGCPSPFEAAGQEIAAASENKRPAWVNDWT